MAYKHGVKVLEQPTSLVTPVEGTAGLQVIFGTAPVNLAKDPYDATNKLKLVYSFAEASEAVGYCKNFAKYTLCQSIYACFNAFNIAPIVLCNVLDPNNSAHIKALEEASYQVSNGQATINVEGILLDKLVVKKDTTPLVADTDYVASFDDNGYVLISLIDNATTTTLTSIKASGTVLNPDGVEYTDVIGGYNTSTGVEKGLELARQVYPKFGMTPGLLLAPGWSSNANVASVLNAKCTKINGVFKCECIIDLDSSDDGLKVYSDCKTFKESAGVMGIHQIALWPEVKIGTLQFAYSALYAAMVAYTDASNDDVPNLSPSNILIGATAAVLHDGTEVVLDEEQANFMNGNGIVTVINDLGFKAWGNNTACYPSNTDPKDRWICCRRFFSWWGNSFILTYKSKVDDNANYRLIESVCDSENIRGNSYEDQGKCAGASISFNEDENPITEILNGHIQFHQKLAPYTPAECITVLLEFDPTILQAKLSGGEA